MNIKSVYEFAWLATQQVVVTSDKEAQDIKGFGSGFFFQYKERLFFVTADHVSHPNDYNEGLRLEREDYVWVFNNKNVSAELATILTPVEGIYSFDLYDLRNKLSVIIPDMVDVCFSILPNSFSFPFLTHELSANDIVVVPAGIEKIIIKEECVTRLACDDYCLVEGCVQWDVNDTIRLHRKNAIHQDLTLDSIDSNGNYKLKYPNRVVYGDWAGLSGAPVFNDKSRLVGMIIEINEVEGTILVVPMEKIMKFMDFALKYEESLSN